MQPAMVIGNTDEEKPSPPSPKGKGKEVISPAQDFEQQISLIRAQMKSTLSRVVASASILPKSMVSGISSLGDLQHMQQQQQRAKDASPSLMHTNTAAGEGSSGQNWASASRESTAILQESFRSRGDVQSHMADQNAISSTFLNPMPVIQTDPIELPQEISRGKAAAAAVPGLHASPVASLLTLEEQQMIDGDAVVTLLSQNNTDIWEVENDDVKLSTHEAEKLRQALFGQHHGHGTTASAVPWDHILNFVPGFLRDNTASDARAMNMGTANSHEARSQWLMQWRDILERYNDEVWGELAPLVHSARDEVRQLEDVNEASNTSPHITEALGKLSFILGRLRAKL